MASEAARRKYPDDYETEPGEVIWNLAEVLREAYDAGRVDALREGAETIRAWRVHRRVDAQRGRLRDRARRARRLPRIVRFRERHMSGIVRYPDRFVRPEQARMLTNAELNQAARAAIQRNVWSPLAKAALVEVWSRWAMTFPVPYTDEALYGRKGERDA